jgi:aspartokinase
MSTLRCTNLQDTSGGNSLTTAQIYNGAAKAWVNFNGTGTVAIRAQFNVSSITDNGTGQYVVNITNALSDANYSCQLSGSSNSSFNMCFVIDSTGVYSATRTTSSIPIAAFRRSDGSNDDAQSINVSFYR